MQLAARRGIETVSGVEMFVAQGTAQWEIWTGERAPEAAMRRAVLRALAQRRENGCAMIQPDFKTFSKLARQGNLVPVYETFTADLLTPVGAHLRLAHNAKYSFLLESVEGGENIARYTFAGANPEEIFRCRGRECTFESGGKRKNFTADPIAYLRKLTERYHPVRVPGLPPLIGGAIGYFAYDMVRLIEKIPASGRDDLNLDDSVMMFYLGLVAFDHVQHRVWVIRNVFTEGKGSLRQKYDAAVREIRRTRRKLESPLPRQRRARPPPPAAHRIEFHQSPLHGRSAQSQKLHPRRRHLSGSAQPALFRANRRRPLRNLSRAARSEPLAVSLLF